MSAPPLTDLVQHMITEVTSNAVLKSFILATEMDQFEKFAYQSNCICLVI